MKKILFAVLMGLALNACSKEVNIRGTEYVLVNTPKSGEITLTFSNEDNRYFGKAVNRYFGTYEIDKNGKLTLSGAASTMMMGPEDLMQAESAYFQNLAKVTGYQTSGDELILLLSNGEKLTFKKYSE